MIMCLCSFTLVTWYCNIFSLIFFIINLTIRSELFNNFLSLSLSQNLRIVGVNEAWGDLGVTAHNLRFTERIEVDEPGPVPALTSALHTLLSQ